MITLYHLCTDENDKPMDATFVDGNGRKYEILYDTPTDIQSDFMAGKILEHLHYYGIVEVLSTRTRGGVTFDMEDAVKRAIDCLRVSEEQCVNDYVQFQLEDRVRKNYPPLPPAGRALACVVKHKVNLLKYGLRPVGWNPPYELDGPAASVVPVNGASPAPSEVDQRIQSLEQTLMQQQAMIIELLSGRKSKGKRASELAGDNDQSEPAEQSQKVTLGQ